MSWRPRIVEVVGPPGAGKTTVCRELIARHEAAVAKPRLRTVGHAPRFAVNAVPLLPKLVQRVPREKVATVLYLEVLAEVLERRNATGAQLRVFDQGPVYHLARIGGPGPDVVVPARLTSWWNASLDRWASLVDLVVRLDAADAVLLARIDAREKWHSLKGAPEDVSFEAVARSRALHERLVSELARRPGGPAEVRFDTGVDGIAEILGRLEGLTTRGPARTRSR